MISPRLTLFFVAVRAVPSDREAQYKSRSFTLQTVATNVNVTFIAFLS